MLAMNRRALLFLLLAALSSAALRFCDAQSPALHRVKTIHVAAMGSGAESDRFHSLLQDELRKSGFEVANTPQNADARLTGTFTAETSGGNSLARATVTLKSRDGKQLLWSGDYVAQHRGEGHEDVVKTVSETCAGQLRKSWEKSAP